MALHRWNFGKKTWTSPVGTAREFYLMSLALSVWKRFAFSGLFAGIATAVLAENTYAPQGGEYPIAGLLAGDQVYPQITLNSSGGYLVWQDNVTDGDGFGISARRINANLSGSFGVFRVNERAAGDQESVRAALLKDGGAVFVWQGGSPGFQHVYARFLKGDGTFATGDLSVNTYTNNHQIDPALTVLADGNVVMTWSSYGQDGSNGAVISNTTIFRTNFVAQQAVISADGRYVVQGHHDRDRHRHELRAAGRVPGIELDDALVGEHATGIEKTENQ